MAKKIVAGNWKMNLSRNEAKDLIDNLNDVVSASDIEVVVFPTSLYVAEVADFAYDNIRVGVQNFSANDNGAYTGELSIEQAKSVGANIGLIGHSERREYNKESNQDLKEKVDAAIAKGFDFIFCCGEPLNIREANTQDQFVKQQLEESLFHLSKEEMKNKVIAYEPIWAIGTGLTASSQQAEDMHAAIRSWIVEKYDQDTANQVSILYGGSCKPSNAPELFACPNVDGGLIGGAALDANSFNGIINSY